MTLSCKFTSFLLGLLAAGIVVVGHSGVGRAQDQDQDADGIPDTVEASLGGNPQHKDIFVECDYMQVDLNGDGDSSDPGEHSHRLSDSVVQKLIQIFAEAPNSNLGGVCRGGPRNNQACRTPSECVDAPCLFTGITLHLEQNQALPEQRFLDFTNRKGGRNFFDIKNATFNFASRAPYYHYCILAHDASEEMGSASGQAEIFGNDFMVTLGSWPNETGLPVGTFNDQVGTFLHELGHNLGLEHGGGSPLPDVQRAKNHKPNYLSVMNYSFQVTGIKRNGVARFDFSRLALPNLVEGNLNEAVGIQDGSDMTRFFCPNGQMRSGVGSGAIDWNCVNPNNSPAVIANINADRTFSADQAIDTLAGYDDWDNLRLNFTTSSVYDAGVGSGYGQHQRYLGLYKPVGITAGRGIDREPEVTRPEGHCLELFSISKEGSANLPIFTLMLRPQPDVSPHNGIGDVCD